MALAVKLGLNLQIVNDSFKIHIIYCRITNLGERQLPESYKPF